MLRIIFRGHQDAGFFARAAGLSSEKSPLELMPGNQRTPEARYACIVVVRDYIRMKRAFAEKAGDWHYSDLEPDILDDVRSGRAVIVFDLSNEGPPYDPDTFSELYSWIELNRLPPGRCIWLAQNRAVEQGAKRHVGARANGVRFDYYDYFVKVIAWCFAPFHRMKILSDEPTTYLDQLFDPLRKDKLLLCLNATPRLPRILTVAALHHYDLANDSFVSFPGTNSAKQGVSVTDVLRFLDQNPGLGFLRPSVEIVCSMPEQKVDHFDEKGNALAFLIDPTTYERSCLSLVTETDFSDGRVERVTEKLTKTYCMGHPTILVGNANSINFLKGLGFQDWDESFDRTAETVLDPASRFQLVLQELLRQISNIRNDKSKWLNAMREIGTYNVRHAISGRFLHEYINSVELPVVSRLQRDIGA